MPIKSLISSEETSFEQGNPVNKTVKAVSDQTTKQVKNLTNDIVSQLYGTSDKSANSLPTDKNQQASTQVKPPVQQGSANTQFPGIQSPQEMIQYHNLQQQLKGEGKSDKEVKQTLTHTQNYFRPNIGTLEDTVARERRKHAQLAEEIKKQNMEEEQKKQQMETDKNNEIIRPVAKGRNRMGGSKKANMGLKMSQMKTETFRGSSG